ncbi:MAG: hypothetical protein KGY76_01440 [Candidatus Thermoplasmatota archaeon]|nr:hypothetical protein [Candidatus Thermoplasmatota archaeon]
MVQGGGQEGGISPELREKLDDVESKVETPTQIRRIKRLQELQNKLEGSHKIKELKDIEKKLFIPQIVGIILLFPFILYLKGASLAPLYLPLFYPLLMLFTLIFILSLEAFVFRMLEIKDHPSDSAKRLMAKNSIKKAITVVIVAIIVFALLYTPYVTDEISKRSSVEDTIQVEEGVTKEVELVSKGRFDFQAIKNITIEVDENSQVNVSLDVKETGESLFNTSVQNLYSHNDLSTGDFKQLLLRFNSTEQMNVKYEVNMEVPEESIFPFSLLSFIYIAAFTEWAAVLYPINERYSGAGIYR